MLPRGRTAQGAIDRVVDNRISPVPSASPLTADELRAVSAPTLVHLGEKSERFPSGEPGPESRRAWWTSTWSSSRAGQSLPVSHTELVLTRLGAFPADRYARS